MDFQGGKASWNKLFKHLLQFWFAICVGNEGNLDLPAGLGCCGEPVIAGLIYCFPSCLPAGKVQCLQLFWGLWWCNHSSSPKRQHKLLSPQCSSYIPGHQLQALSKVIFEYKPIWESQKKHRSGAISDYKSFSAILGIGFPYYALPLGDLFWELPKSVKFPKVHILAVLKCTAVLAS